MIYDKEVHLTFTLCASMPCRTVADELVQTVIARSSVKTRLTRTFVHVFI